MLMVDATAAPVRPTGSWRNSPARELRLNDSFKSVTESDEAVPTLQQAAVTASRSSQPRRSSLRSSRDSDYERPDLSPRGTAKFGLNREGDKDTARTDVLSQAVALHASNSDAKQLHWETDHPVQPPEQHHSAQHKGSDQQQQIRELQAINIKLTADLTVSKSASEMLHKQLQKIQSAMVQSRDDMENAQRLAVAAEKRANTAEEQSAAAQAKAAKLAKEVQYVLQAICAPGFGSDTECATVRRWLTCSSSCKRPKTDHLLLRSGFVAFCMS